MTCLFTTLEARTETTSWSLYLSERTLGVAGE